MSRDGASYDVSYLAAVRGNLHSRHVRSHEIKPCSSRVCFDFSYGRNPEPCEESVSQGVKDSLVSPSVIKRKIIYLGEGGRTKGGDGSRHIFEGQIIQGSLEN